MATLRQCVVLLGPFGGGQPWSGAPLLARYGDRTALAWQLRELVRFGVEDVLLLAGTAADVPVQALAEALPRPARIRHVAVPGECGSFGALLHARAQLDERFLVCPGQALFDANLATLLAADDTQRIGTVLHAQDAPPQEAVVGAFGRSLLPLLHPGDGTREVLRRLVGRGAVHALSTDIWRCGPQDTSRLLRPALLLDRDGVLNVDHGYVGTRERFTWMDGALDAIRLATQRGWHVFVVTNQSGVARGMYDEDAVRTLLGWMGEQAHAAGGTIDDTRYCPYHEAAAVPHYRQAHAWRKPAPGMLLDLIRVWELDPARCVMVGDQASDMQAAAAAGVAGHLFPGGNLLEFVAPLLG